VPAVTDGTVVIIGGTAGIGRRLAETYAARGRDVIVTGRDAERAAGVAAEIGDRAAGVGFDLAQPETIAGALADLGAVDRLVLAALERDENFIEDYDVQAAVRLVTLKLVGYTEVVHTLFDRLTPQASILIFGGQAFLIPYPGSTTVTTVNGGVEGLVHTLAVQLAPTRVNCLHPGIVGDSPYWSAKPDAVRNAMVERTPTGRLATMDEIVDAAIFLLENGAVNGVSLLANGGRLLT
jgi:NAD(P)-dependent dehydrogenase (short-subunit alcohol dehydrogenase family)